LAEVRRAFAAEPLSPYTASLMALSLASGGESAEGVRYGRLAVERAPGALLSHWSLGMALLWDAQPEEAIARLEFSAKLFYRTSFTLSYLAVAYSMCGRAADARAVYQELLDDRGRRYVDYGSLAIAAQAAGDLDAYFEYAHQSCDEREASLLVTFRVSLTMPHVRGDARYPELAARVLVPGTAP
jgi:predicted Zn-dependent protease